MYHHWWCTWYCSIEDSLVNWDLGTDPDVSQSGTTVRKSRCLILIRREKAEGLADLTQCIDTRHLNSGCHCQYALDIRSC